MCNVAKFFLSAIIFSLIASIVIVCLMCVGFLSVSFTVNTHFYLYLLLIILNFLRERGFTLFQVWIASFIFIVLSEMIILAYEENGISQYVYPISYMLIANDILLLGFTIYKPSIKQKCSYVYIVEKKKTFLLFIILLEILYVVSNLYIIANAFAGGSVRGEGMGDSMGSFDALNTFVQGIGLLLPALIAFYFKFCSKRSLLIGIAMVIPILFIQVLIGTRFRLLFAIIPFFIIIGVINWGKSGLRRNLKAVLIVLILGVASSVIRDLRTTAMIDVLSNGEYSVNTKEDGKPFLHSLAYKMSPEGVVYMIKLSDDYFSSHPHHYGKESGYIFYFWIPRAIWENKPTMLDHWLIREYESVSDAHSSASGFGGELKADFGYFSLFFIFLMGMYLKKADLFVRRESNPIMNSFTMVISAAVVPYIFFFVRSPLVSSYSFIFELIIFFLIRIILCRKISVGVP